MRKLSVNGLELWQFENLCREKRINHFVSGRYGANGKDDFTLSFSSTPDKELVRENRRQLATAMGVSDDRLIFPSQVHKTRIVHVNAETSKALLQETDALITAEPGIAIAVMSADCVPILLFDKINRVIAAVHSGWRGTVARILEKTLHEMKRAYGTKGKNIIAGIGPSVSQDSYEVGEEVVKEVTNAFNHAHELMIPQPAGKAKLDLWNANRMQLLEFGVNEKCIEISDLCTVKNNEHFYSARKGDAGRFAAGIVIQ